MKHELTWRVDVYDANYEQYQALDSKSTPRLMPDDLHILGVSKFPTYVSHYMLAKRKCALMHIEHMFLLVLL